MVKKYTDVTFKHMDKIGSLDDFENPEAEVYSSLVTRLSIWKSTLDIRLSCLYANIHEKLQNIPFTRNLLLS